MHLSMRCVQKALRITTYLHSAKPSLFLTLSQQDKGEKGKKNNSQLTMLYNFHPCKTTQTNHQYQKYAL